MLIPGPFVGYLVIDSVRKIFSDDNGLVLRIFKEQPVTMLAASTALGAVTVWVFAEALGRIF